MSVAIVDYGLVPWIGSKAFERAARESGLDLCIVVISSSGCHHACRSGSFYLVLVHLPTAAAGSTKFRHGRRA